MVRSLRTLVAMVACCVAAGCGADSVAAPPTMASIAGTYSLKTYNGLTLPAVMRVSDPKVEVLMDQVTVNANGSWTETGTFRITDPSVGSFEQDETGSGTYTLSGTTITFRQGTDGSVFSATLSGTSFAIMQGTATLIYSR